MQFFKTKELAQRWQCSEMHIYRLVDREELAAVKIGKLLRFKLEDIEAFENTSKTSQVAA